MGESPLNVMVVTGSRADWGYLSVPCAMLRDDPGFKLQLVATGQHLDPASGDSRRAIEAEGFELAATVDMELTGDSPEAVTRSMGIELAGMGEVIARLGPDLMLIIGDRYEILAAASAAMLARLPIAHVAGGDVSEGAIDDVIRHALTKLSHLHFPSNAEAAQRIVQMGENPARVHCIGSTGLDRLLRVPLMDRRAFFNRAGLSPRKTNLLVTIHPVTLAADPLADADALLDALDRLGPDVGVLFTGTNADAGGKELFARLSRFVEAHPNAVLQSSLGTDLYVNALRHCDVVVGNSSSGLYEAPTLKRPTVNVGIRQQGRLRASSVIDCAGDPDAIRSAIAHALALDCSSITNPYGDGHAAERMMAVLKLIEDPAALLRKSFHKEVAS